jgi:hypothetical protein
MTTRLAHGALGNWDELILLGIGVIFLTIMALAWVYSRNTEYDFDDTSKADPESSDSESTPERFKLD